MNNHLENLSLYEKKIWEIREIIISNIVLIGQIPSPTFGEKERVNFFLDRMAEFRVDECNADSGGGPVCVVKGQSKTSKPVFLVTNLDTPRNADAICEYIVSEHTIRGPGVRENSTAVGVLMSFPEIFRRLGLTFDSDIVIVGSIESLGRGNQRGIRKVLQSWTEPIRSAICIESTELGALGCYSDGRLRGEIQCAMEANGAAGPSRAPDAIMVINEVINRMRALRLPRKPHVRIDMEKLSGRVEHGNGAGEAAVGFEIVSGSDRMLTTVFSRIKEMVDGMNREFDVELALNRISELNAARLAYDHPLIACAGDVLKRLRIEPIAGPCETAQPIFLSRGTPAITLAVTHRNNRDPTDEMVEIEPIYKGIAQVLGVMKAMDKGVCDEQKISGKEYISS